MKHTPNLIIAALIGALAFTPTVAQAADPLRSWNDTTPKKAIVAFVEKVTKEGSSDFVPPAERLAVFDNDGTLWPEDPMPFQAAFVMDELKRRAPNEPALAADPMVQAALAGDIAKLLEGPHHDGLMRIVALTHTGMTTEDFDSKIRAPASASSSTTPTPNANSPTTPTRRAAARSSRH